MDPEENEPQRSHTIEQIRDAWLNNRNASDSVWETALGAVYDLGFHAGWEQRAQQGQQLRDEAEVTNA